MIFDQTAGDRKVRVFSLSSGFLDEFKGKQPNWGPVGYFVYKRCVTVDTPVLCEDLTWRPAGEMQEGDGIIGFDEEPIRVHHFDQRYIRLGTVTHNHIEDAEVVGIELEDGSILHATPDHSWLVKYPGNSRVYWRESKDLAATKKGGDVYLMRPFGPVWEPDRTYEGGFLSAAYDGEGCLDRVNGVHFCQRNNGFLAQVEAFLTQKGIPFRKSAKKVREGANPMSGLRTHGLRRLLPFLGTLQPPRLLERFRQGVEKNLGGTLLRCAPDDWVKVVRVFPAGTQKIAVMSTSLKTHFTGGFASHNTYSRDLPDGTTEEWWQTCQRVVEGCFNIQKIHCRQQGLPWDEAMGQKSAQEMFRRMFDFKWSPPGRGLWMMGTDVVYERGAAALLNCAYHSTDRIGEDFSAPFTFLMDLSMLGVGVGLDTRGSGKVRINTPKLSDSPFVVEDSREGWVNLIRVVLDSFVGKGSFPRVIDYSKVRGRGVPLKTFGGIASGPRPLHNLVENLTRILLPLGVTAAFQVDEDETKGVISQATVSLTGEGESFKVASAHLADIANYIGKAVVAGGIRRCLPRGTLVHTAQGLLPIEDMRPGMSVVTSQGLSFVTDWVEQGTQPIWSIETQMGHFECTDKHKIAVMSDVSGGYIWKMARDLEPGDRMVFVDHVVEGSSTTMPAFERVCPLHSTTCKDILIPELDAGLAWLIGLFHGDGYETLTPGKGYVSIAVSEGQEDILQRAKAQLERFGVHVGVLSPTENNRCYKLQISSRQLAEYLSQFKVAKKDIDVPGCIQRGRSEVRAAYVAGLFDADGSSRDRPLVVAASVYPSYLKQVQAVLATLGVPSRWRVHKDKTRAPKGWQPLYHLTVVGEKALVRWQERVAPHSLKYQDGRATTRSGHDYGFPAEMARAAGVSGYREGEKLWSPNSRQITVACLEKITGKECLLIPIEVVGVTPDVRVDETYDISVEAGEFVAQGGYLVHNTAEILFGEPDDEEFMSLKQDKEALNDRRWACVTGDTMVDTTNGAFPIRDLVGRENLRVLLDGDVHAVEGVKKTGTEAVFEIKTFGGPSLKATSNHPVMTARGWVPVSDLKVGDRVRVSDNRTAPIRPNWNTEGYKHGYLLGALIGDGTFTSTTTTGTDIARIMTYVGDAGEASLREYIQSIFSFKTRSDFKGFSGPHGKGTSAYYFISSQGFTQMASGWGVVKGCKTITQKMESAPEGFIAGVISGLFDADGYLTGNGRWGIDSVDEKMLERLQRMLLRLGIMSRRYRVREARTTLFGSKPRKCKPVHRLIVAGYWASERLAALCGIHHPQKRAAWEGFSTPSRSGVQVSKPEFTFEVSSITPAGTEDVFDACVPSVQAFPANGLYVHNSNNSIFARVGMDYSRVAELIASNGEPGICWLENVRRFSRMDGIEDNKDRKAMGTNPCGEQALESGEACVSGDTPLQMQDGVGCIKDFIGKTVSVWNGDQWSSVVPRITGTDRELFRVTLSDGSFLDCTANHGWHVLPEGKRVFRRVETQSLENGSRVVPFSIDAPIKGQNNPVAFETGLFVGDGYLDRRSTGRTYPMVVICGEKAKLQDLDVQGVWRKPQELEGYADPVNRLSLHGLLSVDEAGILNDRTRGLTAAIFGMDRSSILEFVAGWIEADGTVTNKGTPAEGYRIYGSEPKMRDLQILLRRVGIDHATIRLFAEAGEETNFGTRNYSLWYCQIPSFECGEIPTRIKTLSSLGPRTARNNAYPEGAFIDRARKQKIVRIEKLPGLHTTYCFDEPENHMAVFGNALTYQCNLVETYPAHHESYEDFERTLKFAYLYAKTVTLVPTHIPRANAIMTRNRRIGCSMSGIVQAMAKLGRRQFFQWCDTGYDYIQRIDRVYSDWLGIPLSIKTTTTKPSGCRPWYALTSTSKGLLTLEDLLENHPKGQEWATMPDATTRALQVGTISKTYDNGVSPVLRITTSYGIEVESTPNHQWWVKQTYKRGLQKPYQEVNTWKRADEIQPGDILDIQPGVYTVEGGVDLIPLKSLALNMRGDATDIQQPERMTPRLAWLLGYLWGDGAMSPSKYRLRWVDARRENLEKAQAILKEQFGLDADIKQASEHRKAETLEVGSKHLWHWLIRNDVFKLYADKIDIIPKVVRASGQEEILAFLAGLLDADGCTSRAAEDSTLTWTMSDPDFARHVQNVALAVGVVVSRSHVTGGSSFQAKRSMYHLTASGHTTPLALDMLRRHSTKVVEHEARPDFIGWRGEVDGRDGRGLILGKVIRVEFAGEMPTYDIEVADEHWYYAGAVKSHNTVSLLCGATPGIHYPHSQFYIRHIRVQNTSPLVQACRDAGYVVEADTYADDTSVIAFPVEEKHFLKGKDDVTVWEQFLNAADMQRYWSDNAVSVTVTFKKNEVPDIKGCLETFEDRLKGIALLPLSDEDHGYKHAPYVAITADQYASMMSRVRPLALDTSAHDKESEDRFCSGDSCVLKLG